MLFEGMRKGRNCRGFFAVLGFAFSLVCGCAPDSERPSNRTIRGPADLNGARVAHMSSDFHKRELKTLAPAVLFEPYSEYAFAFASLRNGKLDAISIGHTYAEVWQAKFPDEFCVACEYASDSCSFLLPKNSPWTAPLNAALARLAASGEFVKIADKWLKAVKNNELASFETYEAPPGAPVLKVASAAQAEPWCFVAEGRLQGIDIEILNRVAADLGWRLDFKIYSWGGMVDAVNGHRTDIANGGIYTNGLKFPTVDASLPYAEERMCLLVRNPDYHQTCEGWRTWPRALAASFHRTFVEEARWRMLMRGLGVTLAITFLATLLGTLLAFPVWGARTSSCRWVSALAHAYISVLQGTPILVTLMVLFYVIFGSVSLDGFWIAVIGFSLNSSSYIGEMLRAGIASVPVGQREAALALGYRPRQAFLRFVLPQAVRTILPVYRGEIIGLLKSTSIVGYIAINDLTKASDLVRARTYESFFPILTTAAVYFLVAALLAWGLDKLGRRLDPRTKGDAP